MLSLLLINLSNYILLFNEGEGLQAILLRLHAREFIPEVFSFFIFSAKVNLEERLSFLKTILFWVYILFIMVIGENS